MKTMHAAVLAAVAGCALTVVREADAQTFVSGTINWTDQNNTTHAARRTWVEIWTTNLVGGDSLQSRFQTDTRGQYAVDVGIPNPLHTGSYLKVFAENDAATVGNNNDPANTYVLITPTAGRLGIGDNFLNLNVGRGSDAEKSLSVLDAMQTGWDFAKDVRGGTAPAKVNVKFHDADGSAYYAGTQKIGVVRGDAYDWDPVVHEYGHYATFGDNMAVSQPGRHAAGTSSIAGSGTIPALGKQAGARMGYKEGIATWYSIAAQNHKVGVNNVPVNAPRIGNTVYEDTDDLTDSYDLEASAPAAYRRTQGESDELATMRILWDIGDKQGDRGFVNEAYDRVNRGQAQVYADLKAAAVQQGSAIKNLSQVWDYYYDLNGNGVSPTRDRWRTDFGAIFEAHDVSPHPTAVAGTTVDVSDIGITFRWDRGNNNANETFKLIIWRGDFERLYESPLITTGTEFELVGNGLALLQNQFLTFGAQTFKFSILGGDLKNNGGTAYTGEELTSMYWSDAYSFMMVPAPASAALAGLGIVTIVRRRRERA